MSSVTSTSHRRPRLRALITAAGLALAFVVAPQVADPTGAADPPPPDPSITAVMGPNGIGTSVEGGNWTSDADGHVQLELYAPGGTEPLSIAHATPDAAEWGAGFWADFDTTYGPGHRIVAIGDSGAAREITVADVRVTSADRYTGIVTGTTTSAGPVNVTVTLETDAHDPGTINRRAEITGDDAGVYTWTADFTTDPVTANDEWGAALDATTLPVDVLSGRAEVGRTAAQYSTEQIWVSGSGRFWWAQVRHLDGAAYVTFDDGVHQFTTGVFDELNIDHLGVGSIEFGLNEVPSLMEWWGDGDGWSIAVFAADDDALLAEVQLPLLTIETVNTSTGEVTGTADEGLFVNISTGDWDSWDGISFEADASMSWTWTPTDGVHDRNISAQWNSNAGYGHELGLTYAWPAIGYSRDLDVETGTVSHVISSFGGAPVGVVGEWPSSDGATVHIVVVDPGGTHSQEFDAPVIEVPEWGGAGFHVDLGELGIPPEAVGPDWMFTASALIDGVPMSKTLTLADLSVDMVDVDAGTASGRCTAETSDVFVVHVGYSDPAEGFGEDFWNLCEPDGTWSIGFDPAQPVYSVWAVNQDGGLDVHTEAWNFTVSGGPGGYGEPSVQAYVDEEFFRGDGWLPDSSVWVSLYEYDGGPVLGPFDELEFPVFGDGSFWVDAQELEQGLQPGMFLTVTDGAIIKTLQIAEVRFESFDPDTDVIGAFTPDLPTGEVRLHLGDQDGNLLDDGTGHPIAVFPTSPDWTYSLNDPPDGFEYDIDGLTEARIEVVDATSDEGPMPLGDDGTFGQLPFFRADAQWNQIESHLFDGDPQIVVEIFRDQDGTEQQVWASDPVDTSPRGEFWIWSDAGVQAGDRIVVTGLATDIVKELVVAPVTVDIVDTDADLVHGTAGPGAAVTVTAGNDWCGSQVVLTAGTDGSWTADFGSQPGCEGEESIFDLTADMGVEAMVGDPDMDVTTAHPIEPPYFVAVPDDDMIWGEYWYGDGPLQVSIGSETFEAGHDPGEGRFELFLGEYGFDLEAGQFVEVTDGSDTKEHTVTELSVAEIDPVSDTVSGWATAGSVVVVEVDGPMHGYETETTADGSGHWTADFSGVIDIQPGTTGRATQYDDDGDHTRDEWRVRGEPEFGVTATHDWIEVYDFAGAEFEFTIDDDDDADNGVLYTGWFETEPAAVGAIEVIDDFDIEAGQFVSITDGTTAKSTWVSPIEITDVDRDNWIVYGVADRNAVIDAFGFGPIDGFGEHIVQVDDDGDWMLNLADVTSVPDEPIPFGVVLGAGQRDDDQDRTVTFWDPAVVEGRVVVDGDQPVVGAEVFLQNTLGSHYTCTDDSGSFRFDDASVVLQLVRPGIVASGRAVSPDAACANPDFLADDGTPLVAAIETQPFDLMDGGEFITLHAERAAALFPVVVEEPFGEYDWAPVDGVQVRAFDRNDPDFVAAFGTDPDPDLHAQIFHEGIGQIGTFGFTGAYLLSEPGTVEMRIPYLADMLVIVEEVEHIHLGQFTNASGFDERGDGVLVGPTLVFPAAPEITSFSVTTEPVEIGSTVDLTASFTDVDRPDGHTVEISWGDGSFTMIPDAPFDIAASHQYDEVGINVVSLTVTDRYGRSVSVHHEWVVVYDPAGGFATGGGWFDSPAGAYAADPGVTGQVDFAFVAKYPKQSAAPTGELSVDFDAADLHFQSTELSWLVVIGDNAIFTGSGRLDGMGGYTFMVLTADDPGGDLLRIIIWNPDGELIYDNQVSDTSDLTIERGSIVVHAGKK